MKNALNELSAFQKEIPQNSNEQLESYIKEVQIDIFSNSLPHYKILSSYVRENDHSKQTYLDKPIISIYKPVLKNKSTQKQTNSTNLINKPLNSVEWHITAENGKIYLDEDKINLSQQVNIKQIDKQVHIYSQELDLWPEKSYAESLVTVKITTPTSVITTHGLKLDLDKQYYQLLSKVNALIK